MSIDLLLIDGWIKQNMIENYQQNFLVQNNQVGNLDVIFFLINFYSCLIIAANYDIEVQTGSEQIEPLDSPVYMQIYGTTTNTPKFFLEPRNALFAKDSKAKFNISSNNVGEVEKTD